MPLEALRESANRREAAKIATAARRLERRSRGTALETAAAATQALFRDAGVDGTLLIATDDELRRRGDDEALAELARRTAEPVAV